LWKFQKKMKRWGLATLHSQGWLRRQAQMQIQASRWMKRERHRLAKRLAKAKK
jgi:hypothetical protein